MQMASTCAPARADELDSVLKELEQAFEHPLSAAVQQKLEESAKAEQKAGHFLKAASLFKRLVEAHSDDEESDKGHADPKKIAGWELNLADSYSGMADYTKARESYKALLENDPEVSIPDDIRVSALKGLAFLDSVEGHIADAESRLKEAVAIAKKHNLAKELCGSLILQGDIEREKSNFLQSEAEYKEALQTANTLGPSGQGDTAKALNGLAVINALRGNFPEAQRQSDEATALRKKVFGETSLEYASSLETKDFVQALAKRRSAKDSQLEALRIEYAVLGTTAHPTIGNALLNLTDPWLEPSYGASTDLCKSAKHCVDGILAEDTPFFVQYYRTLGSTQDYQAQYKPAIESFKKAIALQRKIYGPGTLTEAQTLRSLALSINYEVNFSNMYIPKASPRLIPEAEDAAKKALDITTEKIGAKSARTAFNSLAIAAVQRTEGRYEEAIATTQKALPILAKTFGTESGYYTAAQEILLPCYIYTKNFALAKPLIASMLSARLAQYGAYDEEVGRLVRKLAECERQDSIDGDYKRVLKIMQDMPTDISRLQGTIDLVKDALFGGTEESKSQGKLVRAEAVLADKERIFGSNSPSLGMDLLAVADAYRAMKKYPEAEDSYKRLLSIQEYGLGDDHIALANTLSSYCKLLTETGKTKEAEAATDRCEKIKKKWGI
ncbi:MAG: tetratricopeptide repeat protein [Cyanobacteria bacterium SZAS TMP-1]|nr:tetratricopeptide repeat protein [Cyanobacteria bacterium SZAS TMP-1]